MHESEKGQREALKSYIRNLLGMIDMLTLMIVVKVQGLYIHQTYQIIHFKYV